MLQNPNFFNPDPIGGAYSAPPDSLTDGEGARCPLPRTPPLVLGLSGLVSMGRMV